MARITERTIQDIIEKKRRAPEPDISASWRMSSLIQSFSSPTKHRNEVIRYYPIAVVAVLDGYFRARLPSLIDSGEPFLANAVEKYSEVKLNLQLGNALSTRQVSLGELIMNSVSISNFQALANIMTSITGRPKCLDEIAQTAPRSFGSETRKPFITNPDDTWSRLSKVFELRHILCHELAADLKIDESETRLLLLAAQEFVRASAAWLESLEAPNIRRRMQERSRTQSAHRARAERQTANLLERTNQLLTTFPLKDGKEIKKAVNEAESYLRSYLSSLKTIGAYGATEMGKMRNQSRVQSIDPESHANLLEPLIDALTKMEFNLQLRAEFER